MARVPAAVYDPRSDPLQFAISPGLSMKLGLFADIKLKEGDRDSVRVLDRWNRFPRDGDSYVQDTKEVKSLWIQ
jgi:hypothetical protein